MTESMSILAKSNAELAYWRTRKDSEGVLANSWYERAFTEPFGITKAFFDGKRVLDIGCGPRGSLEWADNASERVGLDPLAESYRELGSDRHKMRYISAPCEAIPADDGSFDIVCTLNSIDHVDNLDVSIAEIKRVVRIGGIVLLMTDLHEEPTPAEPVVFSWDVIEKFGPECLAVFSRHLEKIEPKNGHSSVFAQVHYDHSNPKKRYGILVAMLQRLR
jgi:ubiquinone/menaquinone biosynthesis C-methylase UbiE